jgi:aryl-alcohol dehydrogenase-like predicted oxidoreductase
MLRDFERDIIPMCRHEGMAIAPWGAIGSGKFKSKKQIEERKASQEGLRYNSDQTELELKVSAALEKVADELGHQPGEVSLTAVALAYCMQKTPYVFPIIGGRRVSHLKDNIKGLTIHLSDEQMGYLESQTSSFSLGFPLTFIGSDPGVKGGKATFIGMNNSARVEFVEGPKPIPGRAFE